MAGRDDPLERMISDAAKVAARAGAAGIGAEHLLFVISGTEDGRRAIEALNGRPRPIRSFLGRALDDASSGLEPLDRVSRIEPSLQFVVEGPVSKARSEQRPISLTAVLRQMLLLGETSPATREALRQGGLVEGAPSGHLGVKLDTSEFEVEQPFSLSEEATPTPSDQDDEAMAHAAASDEAAEAADNAIDGMIESAKPEVDEHHKAVIRAIRDLTALAARGGLDKVIGRDEEIGRVCDALRRRRKSNVMLVGEAGVGKSAIAEGLACMIASGEAPEDLLGRPVLEAPMSSLVAGARFRGDFEARMVKLLEIASKERAILFIDEIHTIVGAGAANGKGGMDAANILKPALARGDVSVIGATTPGFELRSLRADPALMRRFEVLPVDEPSPAIVRTIIDEAVGSYVLHHKVGFNDDMLDAVVDLADRHLPAKRFPDKAFDLIDTSCAIARARGAELVSIEDVRSGVERMGGPRIGSMSKADVERIQGLEERLNARVPGQMGAAAALASAVRVSALNIQPGGTAGTYLFTGPTGVGKSEMAAVFADEMELPLVEVSLNEFLEAHSVGRLIGAPPGYVGFDSEGILSAAAETHPAGVLLLDEADKAHPDVFDVLLQILDKGVFQASDGRRLSMRRWHVILASNLGADQAERTSLGFGRETDPGQVVEEAIAGAFRREFMGRINAHVHFQKLGRAVLEEIARAELAKLSTRLHDAGFDVAFRPSVARELASRSVGEDHAVRALQRLMSKEISNMVAASLLGRAAAGEIVIGFEDGELMVEAKEFREEVPE